MRTDRQAADHLAHRLDPQAGSTGTDLPVAHQREVAELEALARRIGRVADEQPSAAFAARARQRLVRAIEAKRPALPTRASLPLRPLMVWAASLAAVVVVCLAGTAGATYAAAAALPGDVLFPVKAAFELATLDLAPSTSARAALSLEITERRLNEGDALAATGRWAHAGQALTAAAASLDRSTSLLEEVEDPLAQDELTGRLAGLLPHVESAVAAAARASSSEMKSASETLARAGRHALEVGRRLAPQHDFKFDHDEGEGPAHPEKSRHTPPNDGHGKSSKDRGRGPQRTRTPKEPTGPPSK